jgi:flagellar biosynthesis/type III secretory pathway protein FliH
MAQVIKAAKDAADPPSAAAVLKLTDFVTEARAVVLEARKEAARIVAEATAKAEQTTTAAAERGYQEGFARGQNDGYADGQRVGSRQGLEASTEAAADALSIARRIAEELATRREELTEQARRELLEFALAVAERIVGRVAARDVAAAQGNLVKALEMAGFARTITVKVNPAQLASLREHCRQAAEALAIKGRVELVADATIRPGGVKLLTDSGQIDATVEGQLAHIAETLLGSSAASQAQGSYRSQASGDPEGSAVRTPATAGEDHERV